ncbi:ATP-dependent RNA helicase [Entomophthora muscae]|uniref:ATP-dependent RNA helicase n=1 Tax=Entomophthora muscae TaxID=34485 RepID=A0ACC2T2E8_9FUNG|nr:ATP-dependent RNA helicase [Entomophthora muscae]
MTKQTTGQPPLFVASSLGIANTAERLLQNGADPSLVNSEGMCPLGAAATGGHFATCLKLMKHGADPNQTDESGMAPLGLASMEGHIDAVRGLLSNHACVIDHQDRYGWTPLMLSAHLGFGEVVELLLSSGADRTVKNLSGRTAMDLAGEGGHYRIARRLNLPATESGDRPSEGVLLEDADVMDDISLDSDDQKEIQKRLDREDTLDSRSTSSQRTSPVGTLRSRKRFGTIKGLGVAELPMSNLGGVEEEEGESWWEMFSRGVTICCVPMLLSRLGGMRTPGVQQAWREKVALCLVILFISLGLGFLTFGFSSLVCKKVIPIFPDQVLREYGPRSKKMRLMIVRGQLYETGSYFPVGNHRPILPFMDEDLASIIDSYYGQDISDFFPADRASSQCRHWPTLDGADDPCHRLGKNPKMHCHTSHEAWDQLSKLSINNYVAFSWQNISSSPDKLFVFNERVFSLAAYLKPENRDRHFGGELDGVLEGFVGRDVTKDILRHPKLMSLVSCFEEQLLVGRLDGTTIGCFASNLIMLLATAILMTITVIKFTAAMLFDWFLSWKLGKISAKHRPRDTLSHILLLVTCYSEGEHSLRTTLDSLALSDYDDDHKLLFVIADGDVTGSGNAKSTPDLLLDMLEPFYPGVQRTPAPRLYISIGDGPKQSNMACVHMGYYVIEEHRVPFLLIIKCGVSAERGLPKAGNRGKRDSQLILMQWLSNICFNSRMSPLEYDLSEKVRTLCGVTPDSFDMVLMVDADTVVLPDAVSRMVAAMERDPAIMGLCGETKITNKSQSWVTMIQVYEYYISHHLGKAFESIFGGVTCLPGCFCMYRIKIPKSNGYAVPILANPDIVANYSSNDVSTLHKKNLLLLGEDRYLTTLMLRAFPKRKMIYVPKAICKTIVPDEFSVLLSQRRRWINSTIHNLLELVLVPQLCGIFCCSMQFVIFLELLGTVVMPASVLFLLYLVVGIFLGMDVLLPLLFMAALFFMQALLIMLTTRKVSYIAWMFVYILALPVWNLVLPAYSFWHFDDFSWGATRKINGSDPGHGKSSTGTSYQKVPTRRWVEWQQIYVERRLRRDANHQRRVEARKERTRINRQQALAEAHREKFLKHHQNRTALHRFQVASLPEPPTPCYHLPPLTPDDRDGPLCL